MFRAFASTAEAYVNCIDRQRRVVFLNRTLSRDLSQILGARLEDFIAEPHRAPLIETVEAAYASGLPQRTSYSAMLSDGSSRWLETLIVPFVGPDGEPMALQVTGDRTAERSLSEQLDKSEKFRRQIVENLLDYVAILDAEGRFSWVNRVAPGLTQEQVIGSLIDDFLDPADVAKVRASLRCALDSGKPTQWESRGYGDGHRLAWFVSWAVPLFSEENSLLVITSNVTERKEAELALRESEARFRALAEHSPDFTAIVSRSGLFEYVNRALGGVTADGLIGQSLDLLTRPEERQAAHAALESVFAAGSPADYESRSPHDDGYYRVRVAPFESTSKGERALVVITDVSKERADEAARQSLQAQLHQSQRLESIGLLAGGIAHDFNNLLQVIQTNLHFAQRAVDGGGAAAEELRQALRATERAAELTTHLLAIGRRQKVHPKRVDLGDLVARSVRMLRRTIPESIHIDFRSTAPGCQVAVDPPQLEQVLLNLCLNARDAMPDGGILEISVSADEASDQALLLQVRDSGLGIPVAHLSRIFEPFFTTKGAGSGLGLAVAAGIIAAHAGSIWAESSPGKGSTFNVRLPRVEPAEPQPSSQPKPQMRGREVVLMAEDEPLVRSQVVRLLAAAGYEVLEAEDGARAVELFRERQADVNVVFLDVIMPKLDGWQAYLQMAELCPGVRVLFTSGYSANALPDDFGRQGQRLLSKPYRPEELLHLLREILDQPLA